MIVIFKDETDYSHDVHDFLRDFERQTGHILETLDPDTADGMHFCHTYDIVEYPTVIAINEEGILQDLWRGLPLPTISEVSNYVQ